MPFSRPLAEVVAEGRRQARNFRTVILDRDDALRLLDVAEAAMENMEEDSALGRGVDPALADALARLAEGAVVSGEAPGGEGKTCPGCGGLGWIPAGDEQLGCIDCNGTGHAPAPPSTATEPGAGGREEKPCGCFAPDGDACHRHACHRHARPEATPMQISGMHDSCDWCQREIPDGCYGVLCSECDTKAHNALPAPPPRPAQDAVREAAERLREHVHFEDDEDGEPVAFLGSGFEEAFLTLLDALDAAKGGE